MAIDGETQLVGLIGWPVGHSFSPQMHNAAFAERGLNWVYVPLPVRPSEVGAAVRGLRALGLRGANVTVPHKQAVMPFMDEIEAAAAAIGAVNTIVVEETDQRRLLGYNTDWRGFMADLAALDVRVGGRDCLVLGAGGSARAVVYGLQASGGRVQVVARRLEQAQLLVRELGLTTGVTARSLEQLESIAAASQAPLVVNTTPLGMSPASDLSVWPAWLPFPRGTFAYDLVYNPPGTRFMALAKGAGCGTSNGLGMLLRQGAAAFALWTGLEPSLSAMANALPLE
ncbi:MAG: shikimate dehydrogenase [Candidatus Promineifilaceae bacterium]